MANIITYPAIVYGKNEGESRIVQNEDELKQAKADGFVVVGPGESVPWPSLKPAHPIVPPPHATTLPAHPPHVGPKDDDDDDDKPRGRK